MSFCQEEEEWRILREMEQEIPQSVDSDDQEHFREYLSAWTAKNLTRPRQLDNLALICGDPVLIYLEKRFVNRVPNQSLGPPVVIPPDALSLNDLPVTQFDSSKDASKCVFGRLVS